jgi:hypothetical protein
LERERQTKNGYESAEQDAALGLHWDFSLCDY